MDSATRQMQLSRGVAMLRRYGPLNDRDDIKLHDFLAIFHPEISVERREQLVMAHRQEEARKDAERRQASSRRLFELAQERRQAAQRRRRAELKRVITRILERGMPT